MTTATFRPSRECLVMVNQLAAIFGSRETIPDTHAKKLCDLLHAAPEDALRMLVAKKVKFCWMIAARLLRTNFGWAVEDIRAITGSVK